MPYSTLTPLILSEAALAVGAPAPRDTSTRDDWRKSHKFTFKKGDQEIKLLPSEAYFLKDSEDYSPFEADLKTLKTDMAEIRNKMITHDYNNYIIRDKTGRIIATTDDFTCKMVINLDKPNSNIRIDDKGVYFGKGATVENLRTQEVTKDGYMPLPDNYATQIRSYELAINAHSSGCYVNVTHADPGRKLQVTIKSDGPAEIELDEKTNASVNLKQTRSEEMKEVHHRVYLSPNLAKTATALDCHASNTCHRRTITFSGTQEELSPSVTIETFAHYSANERAGHSVDFIIRDRANPVETTSKASYIFVATPTTEPNEFANELREAADETTAKANALREKLKVPMLPPPIPMKAGGIRR